LEAVGLLGTLEHDQLADSDALWRPGAGGIP